MNKSQLIGRIKEVSGIVKKSTGRAIFNKTLETKGRLEKAAGKIQVGFGNLKDHLKKLVP
ncbi:CsbD family protein [Neisseriaceae bacterium JH1-16]|nr:CsbD family protein [Neisseriaceae bacterium JH1-16]